MSTDARSRWSLPQIAPLEFTEEQAQRVQALRVAREVVETRSEAKPFAGAATDAGHPWLLETAQWIISGEMPPEVPTS